MTVPHGKSTDFRLDNSVGTLTDLSAYIDDVDFPQEVSEHEVSGFGLDSSAWIVGLQGATFRIGGPFDSTLNAHMIAVIGQAATLSFQYGPEGDTATNRRYTGECFVTQYKPATKISDAARWTATLRVTGDVTRDAYT